jgi:hypothetical protein
VEGVLQAEAGAEGHLVGRGVRHLREGGGAFLGPGLNLAHHRDLLVEVFVVRVGDTLELLRVEVVAVRLSVVVAPGAAARIDVVVDAVVFPGIAGKVEATALRWT